jgi:hypothetical protein
MERVNALSSARDLWRVAMLPLHRGRAWHRWHRAAAQVLSALRMIWTRRGSHASTCHDVTRHDSTGRPLNPV